MSKLNSLKSNYAVANRKKRLSRLVLEISKPRLEMVEIGCYAGLSTVLFAKRFEKVYAVDPWVNEYDPSDKSSYVFPMSEVEKIFDYHMQSFSNVTKIRKTSVEAAPLIEDESLDFVYIDACHQYENVLTDIKTWLPKIKPKRFIGGHDYQKPWVGVKQAVNEMFGKPDKIFRDSSWLKQI